MDFTGKLGKYKIIQTEDQTKTLWSEYFDQAFHNLVGAYEETLYNYIHGCQIPEQILSGNDVHVLDVGFGLGMGLKAFIDELSKNLIENKTQNFTYTSIELDEDLMLWSIKENFPTFIFTKKDNSYVSSLSINQHTLLITVFIGDGRLTLPRASKENLLPKFTAIFQDAFSPNKNPALWSVEWFSDLVSMSNTMVFLSTYSSSVSIRKSMIVAGWKISNARGFGQKRTMTKARLTGISDPLIEAELARSPALELRDI
jgi:tRNA U34 5-methylaminomethyl-2-thiouridine-forming methyltransferase MnmC